MRQSFQWSMVFFLLHMWRKWILWNKLFICLTSFWTFWLNFTWFSTRTMLFIDVCNDLLQLIHMLNICIALQTKQHFFVWFARTQSIGIFRRGVCFSIECSRCSLVSIIMLCLFIIISIIFSLIIYTCIELYLDEFGIYQNGENINETKRYLYIGV